MNTPITSLSVKNYKGVREINLKPSGSLVVIAGANGSGKSSFIDAIAEIFDPKGTRLTPKPIHEGEEVATAEVVTTEARLVRTWKKNDAGTLAVFALDGAKYPSGKEFVLQATGGALFDPYEFVKLDEKAQRDRLLARVELPFNLDELTAKRQGYFDGRTDVGRVVTRLEAQLKAFGPVDADVPADEVSAAAILKEHEAAREHNAAIDRLYAAAGNAQADRENAVKNVARLEEELDAARTYLTMALETEQTTVAKAIASERKDLDAISSRLASVEEINAKVRAQAQRAAIAAELAATTAQRDDLTSKLDAIDAQKKAGLAGAKFPVDGLSVSDDGITFDGIPFKQVNTAQKTVIAFDLATLAKPDLRLIVVKDGDSLDANSLKGIEKIADERGYIVLVERDRDESREIGFEVVAGELA